MPKVVSEKQINSFIKGLITEASPLTYPENASLDEDNFVLNRNGSRSRRLGIEYELDYVLTSTGLASNVVEGTRCSFHQWPLPDGDTTKHIGVVRIYNKLWFVNLLADNPSGNLLNGGNAVTISGLSNADISTEVINGLFILVSEDISYPILLTYDTTTDTISQEVLYVKVRDIWGVDDGLAIDNRPTTLSAAHNYNLRNQGWSTKITSTCGTDAISCTYTTISKYPSNADIWTLGKVGDSTSADYEKYDPNKLVLNSIDNSSVSRGSYIIDIFARGADRQTLSGISGLPQDLENNSFTTITAYAGRLCFSGVTSQITGKDDNSPNYSSYVFFTQVATSKEKLAKCYQEADPTSPNISDIIDTDGGTIHIPEASRIIKIISSKSSLVVLAENGVWEVFGDTGGFVATSFQLSKVSSVGIANAKAVVESNGTIFYWAKAGIYALVQDQASGRYVAQNLSLTSIQTLYNNIPDISKNNARGYFNESENRIRWLYNDTDSYSSSSFVNRYNRELVLDLTLQAFYPQSITTGSSYPYVCDYVSIPGYATASTNETVYVGSDIVQVGGVDVEITTQTQVNRVTQFGFLTVNGTSFTLSKYRSTSFLDWVTATGTGINYSSYLITGYELLGDLMRKKQSPYIMFYFERTEDGFSLVGSNLVLDNQSSCLVQAQWNWTDSANSGKWGTQFQAYRFNRNYIPTGPGDTFDYGERVIVTKNKLRGIGRSLSLKIQSEQGKDMKLLGWATQFTGNSQP